MVKLRLVNKALYEALAIAADNPFAARVAAAKSR